MVRRRWAQAVISWLLFAGVMAAAAAPPDFEAKVRACASQEDDRRRLACYDSAVERTPQPQKPAPAAGPAADQFGLTSGEVLRKQTQEGPAKRLNARLSTVSANARGRLVLHLDNDQVWEQTEDGPDLRLRAGEAVNIDRGLLGAYWLSPASGRLAIKVRRIQ